MNDADELLHRLRAARFRLVADGNKLLVSPRERITDELRDEIKANRAELLALLMAEHMTNELLRRVRGATA